jgi:transposase
MQAGALIADKANDADVRIHEPLAKVDKSSVIPPKANRAVPRNYGKGTYTKRRLIGNFFAKLKQFRAIAARCDKTA